MKAEDGSGLASYISKTTCKEGSILNRVDLEGKKASFRAKEKFSNKLAPPKEWLPPNKAMSSLSWGHSQEGAVTICQR